MPVTERLREGEVPRTWQSSPELLQPGQDETGSGVWAGGCGAGLGLYRGQAWGSPGSYRGAGRALAGLGGLEDTHSSTQDSAQVCLPKFVQANSFVSGI